MEVIVKTYEDEKDFLAEFISENANHGNALSGWEMKCLAYEYIKKHGGTPEEVARLMNISVKKVESWGGGDNTTEVYKKGNKGVTESLPVKRGFDPPESVTKKQYEEMKAHDRGITVVANCRQLTRRLVDNLIKMDDNNIEALEELQDALNTFLNNFYGNKKVA